MSETEDKYRLLVGYSETSLGIAAKSGPHAHIIMRDLVEWDLYSVEDAYETLGNFLEMLHAR